MLSYLRFSIPILLCLVTFCVKAIPPKEPLPCLNKKFTILAHIVRDSLGQPNITEQEILESIDTLNRHFSSICVSFEICEFNYIDNFQYDNLKWDPEWEEMLTKYHKTNRINMFFVTETDEASICGKATLSGIGIMDRGGIMILKGAPCLTPTSKTVPHEMGHYFGLPHTFEGSGIELADASNCSTTGDEICDTPGDPFVVGDNVANYVNASCRFISMKIDVNGDYYDPIVGNMMSYYPAECACGFTYEQYLKMANTYLNSNPKMW
tara:strand:+ start:4310 stop:5107 length:798 start_codon:yes stop_codon:yes gene_type:complete